MRKILWILFLLAFIGVGIWWKVRSPSPNSWNIANFPPRAEGPIVAFGDSLTEGFGSGAKGMDYPSVLQSIIGRPVVNLGVSGDTIPRASRRLGDVEALQPSMVILFLGGNDLLQRKDLSSSFAALESMIERIQAGGAMVFLVGLEGLPLLAPVGKRYFDTAKKTGAVLVPDVLKGIMGKTGLMADGIHPNEEGYRILAEHIAGAMAPYLR